MRLLNRVYGVQYLDNGVHSLDNGVHNVGQWGSQLGQRSSLFGKRSSLFGHQGMDRPGVLQVLGGSGERRKMEETGYEVTCGALTILAVEGDECVQMKVINVYR